jgi:hypothetical protein
MLNERQDRTTKKKIRKGKESYTGIYPLPKNFHVDPLFSSPEE